jgi:hypothetical protein
MPTSIDWKRCKQCDYEFGQYVLDCRTGEWDLMCPQCGYAESLRRIADEAGKPIGWQHATFDGYCVHDVCEQRRDSSSRLALVGVCGPDRTEHEGQHQQGRDRRRTLVRDALGRQRQAYRGGRGQLVPPHGV